MTALWLRFSALVRLIWILLPGLVWILFLHPLWRRQQQSGLYVVGGHRGRHYGDNAAAVEGHLRRLGRNVRWVANPDKQTEIHAVGPQVLVRHSFRARKAISQASVLIYSHGEDDLDLLLILLRGRTAPRVYLGHSLSLLKGGGLTEASVRRASGPIKAVMIWLITRWDVVLCASEEELNNFKQSYPSDQGAMILGGGAHLDEWKEGAAQPPRRRIYWFPTFRDTAELSAGLVRQIHAVVSSRELRTWLVEHDYEFYLGSHINHELGDTIALQAPFFRASLEQLVPDIRESEMLISDYSGLVFDFLILQRPQILFAFDLDEYQKNRQLLVDYASLDFALHPRTSDELVTFITSGAWRAEHLRAAAQARRLKSLPAESASYAASSVAALDAWVAAFERS